MASLEEVLVPTSDENPTSSPGHLPHPHSTAHFYQALKPKVEVVLP